MDRPEAQLPAAWRSGMRPGSRLYPRARNAYLGWGTSLCALGALLASQVAAAVSWRPGRT